MSLRFVPIKGKPQRFKFMLTVSIYRYNPEIDQEPYMQDFEFDAQGKDLMVLDVLEKLKVEDPTLVF